MRDSTATTEHGTDPLDVTVSGGSMAGLYTGIGLDRNGCDVNVYERSSSDLESRGGGIVAQPEIHRFLDGYDVTDPDRITTTTDRRQYLDRDGSVSRERAESMTFTSWDAVYRQLRSAFPDDRYHMGRDVTDVRPDPDAPTVEFADGTDRVTDLAVVAEGGQSSTRQQLLPDTSPEFADYVAWRGVVPEGDVAEDVRARFEDTFTFYQGPDLLILGYLIPGPDGGTDPGERRLNWVWYDVVGEDRPRETVLTDEDGVERRFSVPPGRVRDPVLDRQLDRADEVLPEVFSRLVRATAEPFVQSIYDLSVPQMTFDGTCLVGDAAFVARPHTAAGTAKAAADGAALAESVARADDVETALAEWEDDRFPAGRRLVARGKEMGDSRLGLTP